MKVAGKIFGKCMYSKLEFQVEPSTLACHCHNASHVTFIYSLQLLAGWEKIGEAER